MRLRLLTLVFFFTLTTYAATEERFTMEVWDTISDYSAFNTIEVHDLRMQKDDVGYLRTGALNRKNILVTPDGFDKVLQAFALQTIQQAATKGDKQLLITIKDFNLADRPTGAEMGTFYSRMDFYLGTHDRYRLYMQVDSFFETSSSWDVTKSLKKLASRKVAGWLRKVAAKGALPVTDSKELSVRDIEAGYVMEKAGYPVYNQPQRVGVYYTLEQFLQNTPGDTAFIQKDYSIDGNKLSYFYEKVEGKKKGRSFDKIDCYAIYNGRKWFKKTSLGMNEMKFIHGDFYFPELGYGLRNTDEIAVMFGLIGALAANGSKGKALYRMRLDPVTGKGVCTERMP